MPIAAGKGVSKLNYKCAKETKQRFIDAMVRLVKKDGYNKVTVRDICKESGLSNGAFYHHFHSKDMLTKAACQNVDGIITPAFRQKCCSLPAAEGLLYLMEGYVSYVEQEIGISVKDYYKTLMDGNNGELFDPSRPFYRLMTQMCARCMDEGLVRQDVSTQQMVDHLMTYLRATAIDWCFKDGKESLVGMFRRNVPLVLKGIFQ